MLASLCQTHEFLRASQGKPLLLIFSGEACKWCRLLKEKLQDEVLQNYCQEKGIELQWITLAPKEEETKKAQSLDILPTREIFQISSIPTAILFKAGVPLQKTAFLDPVTDLGGKAYINWLEGNLPSAT